MFRRFLPLRVSLSHRCREIVFPQTISREIVNVKSGMDDAERQEIADLLTTLAEKREWDHKTWKRCHELVKANLDNELLDSFYPDFLSYPGLFNLVHLFSANKGVGHARRTESDAIRGNAHAVHKCCGGASGWKCSQRLDHPCRAMVITVDIS